ncbi:hypothetical protein [Polaribacter staleyi]|uniref:hypothetical protein n=1 Tax=Polaribacter staleyi TaxID=2022337 RepID=UPI0031BA7F84
MEYRLFYSYQTDSPKKVNELFIENATKEAIKRVKGAKIKLIKGFRGTSGQLPLVETMLLQSESSDIFIGDVTLTAEFNDHVFKEHWCSKSYKKIDVTGKVKKYPNGNVLIETGYSWAKKEYDRTILVMNEAYGIPSELPVDMGHLRWPITYNLPETHSQEVYDREYNQLLTKLKDAIVAALKTTRIHHKNRFKPFKQHDVWNSSDFEKKLIVTTELKDVVNNLRNGLLNSDNPQRLLGPNKSGKTRIARELYRKIDITLKRDEESLEKVLYYDLSTSGYGNIQVKLQDIRDLNQDYIVIVDNCSIKNHKSLCDELHGTNVRILTIANSDQTNIDDQGTIKLNESYASDIIKTGVEKRFNTPLAFEIIQKSGNNIEKAITYISSSIGDQDIIAPDYSDRWKQLLGIELLDAGALYILEELSLFTHVGFNNSFEEHSRFIVSNLPNIINLDKYRGIILKLANRGVIRIVGDFIVLDSFVEELAFQRISKFTGEQFSEYLLEVSKYNLSKQFGQRLIEINKEPNVDLIEQLTGENGLFSDYQFINSDQGSQLILKISEIFPEEIGSLLFEEINEKSTEELKGFDEGRRNIVWCLEKLSLIKETAKEATKLLYKLAIAENESFANNATNAFVQIFQLQISGTIMSLEERLDVLKELLNTFGVNPVILSALNKGLQASNFYGPITWSVDKNELKSYDQEHEIIQIEKEKYFKNIIEILEVLINKGDGFSQNCKEIIIKRFPEQYKLGASDIIIEAIQKIIEKEQELSAEIRHLLEKMVLLTFGLESAKLIEIERLLDKYKPVEDIDKLKIIVINAIYKSVRIDSGWKDLAKEEAQLLAQEWFDINNTFWIDNLSLLFKGKQSHSFAFGERLGEIYQEDENFILRIIEALNSISFEEQNISFIAGFISGKKDDDFTRNVIDNFLKHDNLKFHAFRLTHMLQLKIGDIKKLLPVLNTNPTFVADLQYIKLNNLTDEEIIKIINDISVLPEVGGPFALELLWEVCRNEDRWSGLKSTVRPRLFVKGILRYKTILGTSLHIDDFIKKLTSDGIERKEVQFFINEILNDYSEFNVDNESMLNILLLHFLENKFDIVWPLIGEKLLDRSYYTNYELKNILQYYKFESKKLLTWCEANKPQGAIEMIGIIPIEEKNDIGEFEWTKQASLLIQHYGDNDDFLSALSSRLGNYSVVGSAVPIFKARMKLMESLLTHQKIKVQNFAKEQIERIKIYTAKEQNFDNNYTLGEI